MIITGRYLRCSSDPIVSERKKRDIRTYTLFPLSHGERSGEKPMETRLGITYMAGTNLIGGYKGLGES